MNNFSEYALTWWPFSKAIFYKKVFIKTKLVTVDFLYAKQCKAIIIGIILANEESCQLDINVPWRPDEEVWACWRWDLQSLRTGGCCRTSTLAQTVLSPCTKKAKENDRWVELPKEIVLITFFSWNNLVLTKTRPSLDRRTAAQTIFPVGWSPSTTGTVLSGCAAPWRAAICTRTKGRFPKSLVRILLKKSESVN